jgi:hypothetical protein
MTWAAYGPPWAAYGPQNPSDDGIAGTSCPRTSIGPLAFPQVKACLVLVTMSAPSRIRTCAHGSGVRVSNLANLCTLPARTRSLGSLVAEIIPRIFRILECHRPRRVLWAPAVAVGSAR